MDIKEVLIGEALVLKPASKWIAVYDPSLPFRRVFPRARLGKLVGFHFYVTLQAIAQESEILIVESGHHLEWLTSTDGSGRRYPGFDTTGVSKATLEHIVRMFRLAVDKHLYPESKPLV
jgi:hypothetical protein